ncbi:hypothetical protein, partial [Nitrosomonas sp. Nm34]|uniref:hypothetical protein n=1 Tax=Nitrosomonas sp. Nm34 TaxID=1881055 RepID=UPI0008DF160B
KHFFNQTKTESSSNTQIQQPSFRLISVLENTHSLSQSNMARKRATDNIINTAADTVSLDLEME